MHDDDCRRLQRRSFLTALAGITAATAFTATDAGTTYAATAEADNGRNGPDAAEVGPRASVSEFTHNIRAGRFIGTQIEAKEKSRHDEHGRGFSPRYAIC